MLTHVNGILLLYHRPLIVPDASTVTEHIDSFARHSKFRIWKVNTRLGFPEGLSGLRFDAVALHYSLFGGYVYYLNARFQGYLRQCESSRKIAFFQDEHRYCRRRFDFLDRFKIDCVYTLVEPQHFKDTYEKFTRVRKLVYYIPGYVSEDMVATAGRFALPEAQRSIDIGYRGRSLDYYMGRGGQEKKDIGLEFLKRASGHDLKLDIGVKESDRLYGKRWHRFLGNCRGCLGVEAGVSIFDLSDKIRTACEELLSREPNLTFQEVHDRILAPWEERIPYRTISPRHFEAAAFRICQILFEGRYSGIMQPMKHYIPLKKDFSNFDEVTRLFSDEKVRRGLTENAHRDLVESGRHSYRRFIEEFDAELMRQGLLPEPPADPEHIQTTLTVSKPARLHCILREALNLVGPKLLPQSIREKVRPVLRTLLPPPEADSDGIERGRSRIREFQTYGPLLNLYRFVPRMRPIPPRRESSRSVVFLHHSYYHHYYLAKALRRRGWDALCVSQEDPYGPQAKYFHGEDVNLYSPSDRISRYNQWVFFNEAKRRFRLLHFSGDGLMSFFRRNFSHTRVGDDILEWRRRGLRIAYTMMGCNSGVARSTVARWSIAHGNPAVCDSCSWQHEPQVCNDEKSLSWGRLIGQYCDLIFSEGSPLLDHLDGPKTIREPLMMCLDPEVWRPGLPIPSEFRIDRADGELLVYHGVGNYEQRLREDGRNVKGTPAVIRAIDRLRAEGIPVRLIFVKDIKSSEVRFAQAQADVVVDQLNYGRWGATAREAMMLGKPTICHLNKNETDSSKRSRAVEDIPLISATEDTVYAALKALLLRPEERRRIGEASRDFALRWFNAERAAERYEHIYDQLMAGKTEAFNDSI